MNTLHLPCDSNEVSDGFHTFGELYEHRCLLFIALMTTNKLNSWASKYHHDGTGFEGWFIAGMNLPYASTITYHIPDRLWSLIEKNDLIVLERAPEWDGHTSQDCLNRLFSWLDKKAISL